VGDMVKQQVTVTIEKRLLEWIDSEIEKFRFRNRSHAFEYAIAHVMEWDKKRGLPA